MDDNGKGLASNIALSSRAAAAPAGSTRPTVKITHTQSLNSLADVERELLSLNTQSMWLLQQHIQFLNLQLTHYQTVHNRHVQLAQVQQRLKEKKSGANA